MKHFELEATDKRRKNLKILADYLSSGNPTLKFNMGTYSDITNNPSKWECGTAGCAAGHGPAAGIEPLEDESWDDYIDRVFVEVDQYEEYSWLFNPNWYYVDNTPEGAAKRIYYALENGIPEDYVNQMYGINYIFAK